MKNLMIGAVVVLSACGLTEETFAEQSCANTNACFQAAIDGGVAGITEDLLLDCDADDAAELPEGWTCTFDAAKAAECLDAQAAADCSTAEDMMSSGEASGDACTDVTVCTGPDEADDDAADDTDAGDDTDAAE
jgi:hypothetical protein